MVCVVGGWVWLETSSSVYTPDKKFREVITGAAMMILGKTKGWNLFTE
jgi:hypothetical protein